MLRKGLGWSRLDGEQGDRPFLASRSSRRAYTVAVDSEPELILRTSTVH